MAESNELRQKEKCPFCGEQIGWTETRLRIFSESGWPLYEQEEGIMLRCLSCDMDITKTIKPKGCKT